MHQLFRCGICDIRVDPFGQLGAFISLSKPLHESHTKGQWSITNHNNKLSIREVSMIGIYETDMYLICKDHQTIVRPPSCDSAQTLGSMSHRIERQKFIFYIDPYRVGGCKRSVINNKPQSKNKNIKIINIGHFSSYPAGIPSGLPRFDSRYVGQESQAWSPCVRTIQKQTSNRKN